MESPRRSVNRQLKFAVVVLACFFLLVDHGLAQNARDDRPPIPSDGELTGHAPVDALVGKLDEQIVRNASSAQSDTVMQTAIDLLLALPTAPPIREKLSVVILEHFADRAREAAATGRVGEASQFAKLSTTLKDLLLKTPAPEPLGPSTGPSARTSSATPSDPAGRARRQASPSTVTPPSNGRVSDDPKQDAHPGQPMASIAVSGQGASTTAKQIDKLDRHIADDPYSPGQTEAVSEIVADLLTRLPTASPSESKLLVGLPSHLAERARQAEADGHPETATRFTVVSEITGDLLSTLNDAVAPQTPHQQSADATGASETANGPELATTAPPAPQHDERPPQTVLPLNAPAGQQAAINRLIAKLDKQSTGEASTLAQNEGIARTLTDILAWLRSAPASDSRQLQAVASHLSDRDRGPKINGQDDIANSSAAVADLPQDLRSSATKRDDTASHFLPLDLKSNAKPTMAANENAATGSGVANVGLPAPVQPNPGPPAPSPLTFAKGEMPANAGGNRSSGASHRETGTDAAASNGTMIISADRRLGPQKRATVAAVKVPGAGVSRAKKATSTAAAVDAQCRAITLKFAIGEEPSDAERDYLRHGCHQHG